MEIAKFFYRLYLLDGHNRLVTYLGTAFPIVPEGGLLTCRHVVDISLQRGQCIGVLDFEANRVMRIQQIVYPQAPALDLAFLPNAFQRQKAEYLPILTPSELKIGDDVYSFGFFAIGGSVKDIEEGYFAGSIVNFTGSGQIVSLTLPYAVLEGMSGCPVLTYHNGPKLVGVAYGNRASRILASEVVEVQDHRERFRETVNRIVEFGVAYHPATLERFLCELRISSFVISSERVQVPNL